jgi:hypothetical protein
VAHLDQSGRRHPLQRFAYGGPGHAQQLGEPALAGQRVTRGQRAVDDAAEQLLEDVVGDQPPRDRGERHARHLDGAGGQWSSGMTSG